MVVLSWKEFQNRVEVLGLESFLFCVFSHAVMSDPSQFQGLQPSRLLCPWDFPGKNTGAGCHFLLQAIFSTQGWKLRLLCLLRPLH